MENHWEIVKSGNITAANTPEELFTQACSYFEWCDQHPIIQKRPITSGKDVGKSVSQETARPYSLKGFCLHAGITEEYIRDIRNTKDRDSNYYHVISRILYIIYVQNHELATVGVFNPIFTAKVLNIDNEEVPAGAIKIEIVGEQVALSNSESEVLEKLELEKEQNGIIQM